MPGKVKHVAKKAAAKKAASKKTTGKKTVSKSTSPMVASAPTTASTTTDLKECADYHITTQDQAIEYMNAEILWSTLFIEAWNPDRFNTLKELKQNAGNANAYLEAQGVKRNLPVKVPPGVTLKIVFDDPYTVHLVLPAVVNMPPRPVDMVPHAL